MCLLEIRESCGDSSTMHVSLQNVSCDCPPLISKCATVRGSSLQVTILSFFHQRKNERKNLSMSGPIVLPSVPSLSNPCPTALFIVALEAYVSLLSHLHKV